MSAVAALAAVLAAVSVGRAATRHAVTRSRLALLEGRRPMRARPAPPTAGGDAVANLPDVVDLLRVAADAGYPAPVAVVAVAPRAPPPWDGALDAVAVAVARGRLFVEALHELGRLTGDPGRRLASVLRSASGGADLAAGLERLAIDARDLRRRKVEESARRVPVRLLAPLVLCVLPAFVLLALAPLVAGAFEALQP